MARKTARSAAIQLVFERMLGGDGGEDTLRLIGFTPDEEDQQFLTSILNGVEEHEFELDDMIEQSLKGWTLERIAKVDQAILRVAILEMCFICETPDSVIISEAVALAQKFDLPQSGKFVNGVLASILAQRGEKGADA